MTNALLTADQREYLKATEEERRQEYSKQDRHYYRKQIKKRVEKGVSDISHLLEHWPPEERGDVFSPSGQLWTSTSTAEADAHPIRQVDRGLIDMVAFAWLSAEDAGHSPERIIRKGIRKAVQEKRPDHRAEVDLAVKWHRPEADVELAKLKMREGEQLTDAEQVALLQSSEVPPETLADYVRGDLDGWEPEDGA